MSRNSFKTVRRVAPEDLRAGDFITVSRITVEMLPCAEAYDTHEPAVPRRFTLTPCWSGAPFRVDALCLPYVLAVDSDLDVVTLDLRQHHVVRLAATFGERAFSLARKQALRRK